MHFKYYYFVAFLWVSILNAQNSNNWIGKMNSEMERRGISETDLKIALDNRGIDLEELKSMEPSEVLKYQAEIEGVMNELEQKNVQAKLKKPKVPSAIDDKKNKKKFESIQDSNRTKSKQDEAQISTRLKDSLRLAMNDTLKNVEIWGQHIFRNKNTALYESSSEAKAPSTYTLGVGDKISVSIWGVSQFNEQFEINAEGYITPSRMPRIFLKGITLARAKPMLSNYFRRFYRFESNQFDFNLISSRTVQVNIVGEVEHYGTFTLPSINSTFNALVAAGGPNKIGSVRKIKLIRNGKDRNIDVYKYLLNPSSVGDISIENNDYIQVPVVGKVVKILGAVNRPFKYELLDGEELNALIFYAGGLTESAITKTVQVDRFENDRRIVLDVPLNELQKTKGDFKLKNGDIVTVFSVKTENEDFVYVKGEVRSEAAYKFVEGMTIGDLIKKIDFTYEADLNNAFLKRNNPDNTTNLIRINLVNVRKGLTDASIRLQAKDALEVYKLASFTDQTYVTITGAVRKGGRFPLNVKEDIRVKDLILLAGGLKSNTFANGYLFRTDNSNLKELQVIKLSLVDIMKDDQSEKNIFIKPFDSLVVFSGDQFTSYSYVEISGAVKSPGKFQYSKALKLKDLITFAEGFTLSAASNKIDIYRIKIVDNQPTKTIVKSFETTKDLLAEDAGSSFELEPFDVVVVRNQPNFEFQKIVYIEGEVLYPGPYAIINNNERVADIIQRAGGLTIESFSEGATLFRVQDDIGYIVMDLTDAMKNPKSRNNMLVKDKDLISIPKRKDFVRISGETNVSLLYPEKLISSNNSVNVAYYEGKRAKFYINNFAAGLNQNADANRITVEHSNGRIESTKRTWFGRKYPKVYKGSIINVGAKTPKEIKERKERKDIDWGKVVADSIAQATGVLSLILLIQRLN